MNEGGEQTLGGQSECRTKESLKKGRDNQLLGFPNISLKIL